MYFFCLGSQTVEIGCLAHLIGAYAAGAACDERPGIEHFACGFFDGDRFSRQERFIDFGIAVQKDAICRDLLSGFQQQDIVEYDVPHVHFASDAAANHFGGGSNKHGKFVDLFFCKDLLDDADQKVCGKDGDKEKLRKLRSGICQGKGDDQTKEIEYRTEIADENARVGFAEFFIDVVEEHLRESQIDLFFRESFFGIGRKTLDVLRFGNMLGTAELLHEFLA